MDECSGEGLVRLAPDGRIDAFVLYCDAGCAWEISFLATAPEARGRGCMMALLAQLIAVRPSDRPIWLEVHEGNAAARRIYLSSGFKESGRRRRYYSDGGDAILYNYE